MVLLRRRRGRALLRGRLLQPCRQTGQGALGLSETSVGVGAATSPDPPPVRARRSQGSTALEPLLQWASRLAFSCEAVWRPWGVSQAALVALRFRSTLQVRSV
jgi:hypothetical protein